LIVALKCWCCDWKDQAASVLTLLSFTLWQQATIKITHHDHSIIACWRHLHMGAILHAHPVCGELHIQRHSYQVVAIPCPSFYNKWHRSHILFMKVAPTICFFSIIDQKNFSMMENK